MAGRRNTVRSGARLPRSRRAESPSSQPSDATSVQMQIELAIEATETVAITICRELSSEGKALTPSALEGFSAATRFFENLAKNLNVSVDHALDMAATEPVLLRAHLESAFDMRGATTSALKEK